MQPGLPFDFPALLNSADALIRDPGFWWEVGVLLLAAAGAWMVHRTLGHGLAARTEGGEDYTVRYLALMTLQRALFDSWSRGVWPMSNRRYTQTLQ